MRRMRGGAIGGRLRAGAEEAAAGDLVLGRQRQPRGEVLLRGPARHVGADLGEQPQRIVRADAVDLREIDAGELVERRADVEARLVVARVCARRGAGSGVGGGAAAAASVREMGLDGAHRTRRAAADRCRRVRDSAETKTCSGR